MKHRLLQGMAISTAILASLTAAGEDTEYYNDRYCTTCHGTDGRGSEGVQGPRLAGMEAWYLQRQLQNFRSGIRGTHPEDFQGSEMQPMAVPLTDSSISDLLEWIGRWDYVPTAVTLSGDVEAGKALYSSCTSCHGTNGEGNVSLGAPALAGQNDWYLVTQLKNFKAGYRGTDPRDTFGSQMAPMASLLQDEKAMNDVVSYINMLAR